MPDLPSSPSEPQKITYLGKAVILLFVVGCILGGVYLLGGKKFVSGDTSVARTTGSSTVPSASAPVVEINIAYGTEKERWLKWAVQEFAQAKEGAGIKINLLSYGSLEGAQAALNADKQITVWSPASGLYKENFALDWQSRYNGQAIVREAPLALTPMVFVMWAERYDAFIKKYAALNFNTIAQALAEPGWKSIADKPEWGLFKFGHTHPNESNSGLMTLALLAYEYTGKDRTLTLDDIQSPAFQKWMTDFERGVNGLSNSTGNMMKEMVLKGPSSFDGLCVYENVAIDYLRNAEGRWGELRVAYPEHNLWNDNPYYILNAPWSGPEQRRAAGQFLDFLLSTRVQQESLVHGFRPANTDVAVRFPESPFIKNARYGVRVDPPVQAEPPGRKSSITCWRCGSERAGHDNTGREGRRSAMWRYLKEAFWARVTLPAVGPLPVNVLAVFGFGILGCAEHAVWLLGLGLETAYLYALATHPRFQKVIRARDQFQVQQGTEQGRRDLLGKLSPEERARVEQLEGKIRRAADFSRGDADVDLLAGTNLDALEKLGAMHLRLLGVEHDLQAIQQQTDQAGLIRQSAVLEEELNTPGGPLSAALRESKQATLALTQKRLLNGQRRAESIAEVRSDLTRIEAQVELAVEDASLEGRPNVISSNLNLLNRILESNSALRSDGLLDRSGASLLGREVRNLYFEG